MATNQVYTWNEWNQYYQWKEQFLQNQTMLDSKYTSESTQMTPAESDN